MRFAEGGYEVLPSKYPKNVHKAMANWRRGVADATSLFYVSASGGRYEERNSRSRTAVVLDPVGHALTTLLRFKRTIFACAVYPRATLSDQWDVAKLQGTLRQQCPARCASNCSVRTARATVRS